MISFQKKNFGLVRRYPIVGGRRLSNYWWSIVIFLGGSGFLITGISSYFNRNLLQVMPKAENVTLSIFQPGRTTQNDTMEIKMSPFFSSQGTKIASSIENLSSLANFSFSQDEEQHRNKNKSIPALLTPKLLASPVPYYQELSEYRVTNIHTIFDGKVADGSVSPDHDGMGLGGWGYALASSFGTQRSWPGQGLRSWQSKGVIIPTKLSVSPFGVRGTDNSTFLPDTIFLIPSLPFFPQGLVLSFYGFLGLCLSFHLWLTIVWKIGSGFNEFNGKEKSVRIFRWGRPGKNRRIDFTYPSESIETIKIELFPKPALFLRIKGEKKIPLTRIGDFIPLDDLEIQAAELTRLLQIPLEIEGTS